MADESPHSPASDDDAASPTEADLDREPTTERSPDEGAGSTPTSRPTADRPGRDQDQDTDRDPDGPQSREEPVDADQTPPTTSASEEDGTGSDPATGAPRAAAVEADPAGHGAEDRQPNAADDVPADVRQYDRFKKIDGARYERVNEFLRDRTYITAREWAIARLCADFRTETGSEMTKIGENLPELVPFMTDTYTPQAVNQARAAFEDKVRKAGATFLYGAMCDFFTADQLDEVMYEATEVAKFLLEVEGVDLAVEEELEAEDRISSVMREVRHASESLRYEGVECPHCGEPIDADGHDE